MLHNQLMPDADGSCKMGFTSSRQSEHEDVFGSPGEVAGKQT